VGTFSVVMPPHTFLRHRAFDLANNATKSCPIYRPRRESRAYLRFRGVRLYGSGNGGGKSIELASSSGISRLNKQPQRTNSALVDWCGATPMPHPMASKDCLEIPSGSVRRGAFRQSCPPALASYALAILSTATACHTGRNCPNPSVGPGTTIQQQVS
jgi:hypothetical protein